MGGSGAWEGIGESSLLEGYGKNVAFGRHGRIIAFGGVREERCFWKGWGGTEFLEPWAHSLLVLAAAQSNAAARKGSGSSRFVAYLPARQSTFIFMATYILYLTAQETGDCSSKCVRDDITP